MTKSPKWKNLVLQGASGLRLQVNTLQSSVQRWERKLSEMQESHRSVITQHDSKIAEMATKLKAIRARMKKGTRRIKDLESKLIVAVNEARKQEEFIDPSIPICNSSSLDELNMTNSVEDGEAGDKVPAKAKRKRKPDSLRRKQAKLDEADSNAIISEEVTTGVSNTKDGLTNQLKNRSDKVENLPVAMEIVTTKNDPFKPFQRAEAVVNIERIGESEILKYTNSPIKGNQNVDAAGSLKKRRNSVIEAGKKSGACMEEISSFKEATWECSICGKKFPTLFVRDDHEINTHREAEESLQCPTCTSPFKRKRDLLRHLEIHNLEKPKFKCEICEVTFRRQDSLKLHTLMHSEEMLFKCSACNVSFITNSKLLKHLASEYHQTYATRRYECPICLRRFQREDNLRSHLPRKHGKSSIEEIRSAEHNAVLLNQPQESKEERASEEIPAFEFSKVRKQKAKVPKPVTITQTALYDVQTKLYECSLCPKTYSNAYCMNEHLRQHTGKPINYSTDNHTPQKSAPSKVKPGKKVFDTPSKSKSSDLEGSFYEKEKLEKETSFSSSKILSTPLPVHNEAEKFTPSKAKSRSKVNEKVSESKSTKHEDLLSQNIEQDTQASSNTTTISITPLPVHNEAENVTPSRAKSRNRGNEKASKSKTKSSANVGSSSDKQKVEPEREPKKPADSNEIHVSQTPVPVHNEAEKTTPSKAKARKSSSEKASKSESMGSDRLEPEKQVNSSPIKISRTPLLVRSEAENGTPLKALLLRPRKTSNEKVSKSKSMGLANSSSEKIESEPKHAGSSPIRTSLIPLPVQVVVKIEDVSPNKSKSLEPYDCPTCHKKFTEKIKFEEHKKLHARVTFLKQCPVCVKMQKSKAALTKHLEKQHPEHKCFECPICQGMHFSRGNLRKHLRTHTVSATHKCSKCVTSFPDRHTWTDHVEECEKTSITSTESIKTSGNKTKSVKTVAHKCATCRKNFCSSSNLRRHVLSVHSKPKPKPLAPSLSLKTKIRRKTSGNKSKPEDAKANSEAKQTGIQSSDVKPTSPKKVQCSVCQNFYASKSLKQHLKIHSRPAAPSRMYSCNFCKNLYRTWVEFEGHVGTHEELFTKTKKLPPPSRGRQSITKFVCSECCKACDSVEILKLHFAKSHAWKKNYNCGACNKSFCTSEGLKRHSRTHKKAQDMAADFDDDE